MLASVKCHARAFAQRFSLRSFPRNFEQKRDYLIHDCVAWHKVAKGFSQLRGNVLNSWVNVKPLF